MCNLYRYVAVGEVATYLHAINPIEEHAPEVGKYV
jgi:hypothetical protein